MGVWMIYQAKLLAAKFCDTKPANEDLAFTSTYFL